MTVSLTLGKWHHGASNDVECLGDHDSGTADGWLGDGLSDSAALALAREHIEATGHSVEVARTIYRTVKRFPA